MKVHIFTLCEKTRNRDLDQKTFQEGFQDRELLRLCHHSELGLNLGSEMHCQQVK